MTFLLCTSHSYIAESRPFPECLSEMTLWMQVAPTLVSVFATSARSLVGASIQSSAFWIHPFRFAKNGALRRQIKLHCFWSQGIHTHIHTLPLRASPSSPEVLDNVFSRPCRLDKSRVCQVCRIGELISFKCGRGMPCSGSYWVKTFGSRGPSSVAEQKQQRLITLILAPVGEYYVILGSEASDFGFCLSPSVRALPLGLMHCVSPEMEHFALWAAFRSVRVSTLSGTKLVAWLVAHDRWPGKMNIHMRKWESQNFSRSTSLLSFLSAKSTGADARDMHRSSGWQPLGRMELASDGLGLA